MTVPVLFRISSESSRTPLPSKRSDEVARSNVSPYATPWSIAMLAEAERPLVRAVEVELAGHQTLHRIVVELERVAKVGERPAIEPDARVDLLAAVLARVAERELAVGANLRLARTS